ncbi:MAG TPA: hypothetical protein DCP08_04795 [Chloroflexi bacterium]|nr:hypothetical protein [Chloroflexota bacterium]
MERNEVGRAISLAQDVRRHFHVFHEDTAKLTRLLDHDYSEIVGVPQTVRRRFAIERALETMFGNLHGGWHLELWATLAPIEFRLKLGSAWAQYQARNAQEVHYYQKYSSRLSEPDVVEAIKGEMRWLSMVDLNSKVVWCTAVDIATSTGASSQDGLEAAWFDDVNQAFVQLEKHSLIRRDASLRAQLSRLTLKQLTDYMVQRGIAGRGRKNRLIDLILENSPQSEIIDYLSKHHLPRVVELTLTYPAATRMFVRMQLYRLNIYVRWLEQTVEIGKKWGGDFADLDECLQEARIAKRTARSRFPAFPRWTGARMSPYTRRDFQKEALEYLKRPEIPVVEMFWDEHCDEIVKQLAETYRFQAPWHARETLREYWGPDRMNLLDSKLDEIRGAHSAVAYYAKARLYLLGCYPEPKRRRCAVCGADYWEDELGSRDVERMGGRYSFCRECVTIACQPDYRVRSGRRRSRQQKLADLVELSEALERVPTKSFVRNPVISPSLSEDEAKRIVKVLVHIASPDIYEEEFGSWLEALTEAGILETPARPTVFGVECLAKDGHLCASLAEKTVDDWLFEQEIPHEREPKYPYDPELNPSGLLRADWKIHDIYVEYYGLDSPEYLLKAREKAKLARRHNLRLIEINPEDLEALEEKFDQVLNAGNGEPK